MGNLEMHQNQTQSGTCLKSFQKNTTSPQRIAKLIPFVLLRQTLLRQPQSRPIQQISLHFRISITKRYPFPEHNQNSVLELVSEVGS